MEKVVSTSKTIVPEIVDEKRHLPAKASEFAETDAALPVGKDYIAEREALVDKHYGAEIRLSQRMKGDGSKIDGIINSALEELVKESENLLGNELVLMQAGQVRDSSIISVKRSDVLDTLTKVAQRKYDILSSMSNVDLNSPVFQIFQQICVDNLVLSMKENGVISEMRQLILNKFADLMKTWDKELKFRMDSLKVDVK